MKVFFHFVNQYHQLPEEHLITWVGSINHLGAVSLVLDATEGKSMIWLTRDPQLAMEQSLTALCDPDTREVIPKGTDRLVNLIKATKQSVYPGKGDKTIDVKLRGLVFQEDGSADRNTTATVGQFR